MWIQKKQSTVRIALNVKNLVSTWAFCQCQGVGQRQEFLLGSQLDLANLVVTLSMCSLLKKWQLSITSECRGSLWSVVENTKSIHHSRAQWRELRNRSISTNHNSCAYRLTFRDNVISTIHCNHYTRFHNHNWQSDKIKVYLPADNVVYPRYVFEYSETTGKLGVAAADDQFRN